MRQHNMQLATTPWGMRCGTWDNKMRHETTTWSTDNNMKHEAWNMKHETTSSMKQHEAWQQLLPLYRYKVRPLLRSLLSLKRWWLVFGLVGKVCERHHFPVEKLQYLNQELPALIPNKPSEVPFCEPVTKKSFMKHEATWSYRQWAAESNWRIAFCTEIIRRRWVTRWHAVTRR